MRDGARSLALVAVLLVSTLAGVVPATALADSSAPSGMVALDDSAISEDVPSGASLPVSVSDFEGGKVLASDHAASMSLTLTTASHADEVMGTDAARLGGDGMALVLSDDTHHAGREVAIEATVLRNSLGYLPETVEGVHDDGSQWERPVQYRDGFVMFEVPEFSSNTVTFGGEVVLRGDPATDGSSYEYDISNMDSASAPNLTLTGAESVEWDNATGYGLGNGATLPVNPSGHRIEGPDSGEPEVVFTGAMKESSQKTHSASGLSPSGSDSISIGGNRNPGGPSNGNPSVAVTGHAASTQPFTSEDDSQDIGDYSRELEFQIPDTPAGKITKLKWYIDSPDEASTNVDVYLNQNGINSQYGEGTKVASTGLSMDPGWQTIPLDTAYDAGGESVTVEVVVTDTYSNTAYYLDTETTSSTRMSVDGTTYSEGAHIKAVSEPTNVAVDDNLGHSATVGDLSDGQTKTVALNLDREATKLDFSGSGGSIDYELQYTERTVTDSPAIDLDGDGVDEVSHSGILSEGETATYQVPGLSPGDDTATVSTAGGSLVDASVHLKEVSESRNIGVEVNGNWQNHSTALADGETAEYQLSESWLSNGTNRINVSVAPGLSADAPAPSVGVEYRHATRDDQSVAYKGESWSERYNVSRTWGEGVENATLTVPFEGNVVSTRELRVYLNGSETAPTWSRFSNTTLTVGLGDVAPGTETRVRATGSKVRVEHGAIQVLDPTTKGNDLDSKVEVTTRDVNEPLTIAYGGTSGADRVHYALNESWSGADEVHRATASGDRELRMDAPDGGTFRVQTLPLEAKPKQGDVELSVSEPRQEEPQFYVRPGDSSGDTVKFTYLNADADQKYLLYSKSEGVVRESGTANSPVTLTDDDSAERLVFRLDDSGTSQPPTNDWTEGFPEPPAQFEQASSGGNLPVVLLVSGLGIALLWYVRRSTRGASGVAGLAGRALSSNVVLGALVVSVVGVGAAVGGVSLPPGAGLFLLVTGVPVVTYLGLRKAGQYSHVAFGAVTAVALILGLQLLGGNVVSSLLGNLGPSMPIFAIGGLYVAYQAIKAYREGKTVNLSVRGIRQSSNDEEGGS